MKLYKKMLTFINNEQEMAAGKLGGQQAVQRGLKIKTVWPT